MTTKKLRIICCMYITAQLNNINTDKLKAIYKVSSNSFTNDMYHYLNNDICKEMALILWYFYTYLEL